jgi:hypothetical protein
MSPERVPGQHGAINAPAVQDRDRVGHVLRHRARPVSRRRPQAALLEGYEAPACHFGFQPVPVLRHAGPAMQESTVGPVPLSQPAITPTSVATSKEVCVTPIP